VADEVDPGPETRCPSCGLVGSRRGLPEPPFPASAGCWWAYGQLTSYNVERSLADFRHQEAVDAYAAQHPGPPARPITLWFALVGLHLAVDLGCNGRQVQRAHLRLARHRRPWPALPPPARRPTTTVADVLAHLYGPSRDAAILDWASDVWACWPEQHAVVAEVAATTQTPDRRGDQ
jgi:hypothetical protein